MLDILTSLTLKTASTKGEIMEHSKKVFIIFCTSLLALTFSACDSTNAEKFYGQTSDVSSISSVDTSASDKSAPDITKDYSLEIPKYDNFQLGKYKGVTYYIDDSSYEITDAFVLNKMASELNLSLHKISNRTAAYDDTITVSFKGTIDKKEFDGNSADKYRFILGTGQLLSDFEKTFIGMSPNETKTVNYTFPKNYTDSELAGKTAVFTVTLNEIENYSEKDVTDKLVSEKTEYKTAKEYKAACKKELKQQADTSKKLAASSAIMSKIIDDSTVKSYDEDQIKELIESAKNATKLYAVNKNMTEDEYVKSQYGFDSYTDYEKNLKSSAKEYIKSIMTVSAIAHAENLNVTDNEYQKQIDTYMNKYNISENELGNYYKSEDIIFSIITEKVQNWLIKNSVKLDSPETDNK